MKEVNASSNASVDATGYGAGGSHGGGAGANGHVRITVVATGKVYDFDKDAAWQLV